MKYLPLFEILIRHTFYSDGRCPDFMIKPGNRTLQLLKNSRSIIKTLPDGLRLITSVDEDGNAFVPFISGTVLDFDLWMQNQEIPFITDLTKISAQTSPLFTNKAMTTEEESELTLTSSMATMVETFEVANPAADEMFVLRGNPQPGTTAADFKIESAEKVTAVAEYDAEDRLIKLDSSSANQGDSFTVSYPLADPLPTGVFARIQIHLNASLPDLTKPQDTAKEFRISFNAKQANWAYYCVTDLDHPDTAYRIVDTPPSGEGVALGFSEQNRRNLDTNPDPEDLLAIELAGRYPSLKRYRFLSDTVIPCRQQAHKHLALQINGRNMSGALPNPSFRNFSTVPVKVGDSIQQQDWLYQVVKVLTQNGA